MITYLPIAIVGFALNGGSTLIDKILLNKSLPSPFIYTFYINILGLLAILLIPFGLILSPEVLVSGILAGVIFVFALLYYFESLRVGEASVVAPVVGSFNPLFALLIGAIFLKQAITNTELLAFSILIFGATILTANIWLAKLKLNKQLLFMIIAGFCFGLSAVILRETFLLSNFITGLVISRLGGALVVLFFLFNPKIRSQIFSSKVSKNNFLNKTSLLMFSGQTLGALSGLLIAFAVSLANPALVNSLFGMQYLVILIAVFILEKYHPNLLDENFTKAILAQKIIGVGVLSLGVYMLSK